MPAPRNQGPYSKKSVWRLWPLQSAVMDPLTQPSQSVNLACIVAGVMGPPEADLLLLLV
jgi:hypothetical protein